MIPLLSLLVRDVMTPEPVTVTPDTTLADLRTRFEKLGFTSFPVVDDGRLVGIVSEFDLLQACLLRPTSIIPHFDEILSKPVSEIMSADWISVGPEEPLSHVIEKMVAHRHKSLPVVDGGKLIGIIGRTDILTGLHETIRGAG